VNSYKCGNCGLVNAASEDICKRCKAVINKNWKPIDLDAIPSKQASKLSAAPFVVLAFLVGVGFVLWKFTPIADSLSSAVGKAQAPPAAAAVEGAPAGEKPLLQQAIAPANNAQAPQTGAYKSTIENGKAISDANSHVKQIDQLSSPEPKAVPKKNV
jgi:hypothetical protein